jgi:hypothetical protein
MTSRTLFIAGIGRIIDPVLFQDREVIAVLPAREKETAYVCP